MQLRKTVLSFIFIAFSWLAITSTCFASGDPVGMLQSIANNMIAGLKSNQATLKSKPQVVYSLANRYVVPFADLSAMSKSVVPPQTWNSASGSQRAQFQQAFTRTLIRTYASALTSYKDQTIKFYPLRGGAQGNSVQVESDIISSDHDPIHVTYTLIRSGGGWRLYDMSVEGVDMLESFRAQFSDILSQGNMDQLLSRLASHNSGARS